MEKNISKKWVHTLLKVPTGYSNSSIGLFKFYCEQKGNNVSSCVLCQGKKDKKDMRAIFFVETIQDGEERKKCYLYPICSSCLNELSKKILENPDNIIIVCVNEEDLLLIQDCGISDFKEDLLIE